MLVLALDWVAFFLRVFLADTSFAKSLQTRIEVSTPHNSFLRVKEGVALFNNGMCPYDGDTYHGSPIILYGIRFLLDNCPNSLKLIYALVDLITAWCLHIATRSYLRLLVEKENTPQRASMMGYQPLLITKEMRDNAPVVVKLVYLFNPLTIFSCLAYTTTTFNNMFIAIGLALMTLNQSIIAAAFIAVAAYNDYYPFILLGPVLLTSRMFQTSKRYHRNPRITAVYAFFVWLATTWLLLYVSSGLCNGWSFLQGTYGFILSASDLTPNIGIFWYFFTEIFQHFHAFYMWVFQMNSLIHVIPICICLRDDPVVAFYMLLSVTSVFKSYPSVGDAALLLGFLPAFGHLNRFIRHKFFVVTALITCAALMPVMWYLWIQTGSGNANFYFAITLLYAIAHIFLMTDVLYAYLRRQLHLIHGLKPMLNGNKCAVTLD